MLFPEGQLQKAGGEKPGVTIWSTMRILQSRLERGKRYVRTGTVIDLKIQKGKIIARVQGTRKTPYRVEIRISPLTEKKCEAILERCGKIETLNDYCPVISRMI